MKSFAVAMVATMSLCGFFIQNMAANIDCYACEEKNITACGNMTKIGRPGHDFAISPSCDSTTSVCYFFSVKVTPKHVSVLRGCVKGTGENACDLVKSKYERDGACNVCSTSFCNGRKVDNDNEFQAPSTLNNGQSQVAGFAVKCALISSLVVARIFFNTK